MAEEQIEFDCIGKAEAEGQPKPFSLIASDPMAADLVNLWAMLSSGNPLGAMELFAHMVNNSAASFATKPRSPEKIDSAERMARDFEEWREDKGLPTWRY